MVRLNKCSNLVECSLRSKCFRASSSRKFGREQTKKRKEGEGEGEGEGRGGEGEGREENKVNFSNLVFYSLSILTSCQFTNEPNREVSRGVFQNSGVCGQACLLLPSPFHIFYSRSNVRAITRLGTLATHARSSVLISVTWVELLWAVFPNNIDLKRSFVRCRKYHKLWRNGAAEFHISVDLLYGTTAAGTFERWTLWKIQQTEIDSTLLENSCNMYALRRFSKLSKDERFTKTE